MKALASCVALAMAVAALAGCAGPGSSRHLQAGAPGVVSPAAITPQGAKDAIAIGRSTKGDVAAALGKPIAIAFDSGWEVWVYRWPGAQPTARAATELVVLFPPSGVVSKTRIRPGYASDR